MILVYVIDLDILINFNSLAAHGNYCLHTHLCLLELIYDESKVKFMGLQLQRTKID